MASDDVDSVSTPTHRTREPGMPMMRLIPALALLLFLVESSYVLGDEFDRFEGEVLTRLASDQTLKKHESLSLKQLDALPQVLKDTRSAFILVKTDQDNITRL